MALDLGSEEGPGLHWHAELRPRHTRLAGFKQMIGVGVRAMTPEDAALRLRAAL